MHPAFFSRLFRVPGLDKVTRKIDSGYIPFWRILPRGRIDR